MKNTRQTHISNIRYNYLKILNKELLAPKPGPIVQEWLVLTGGIVKFHEIFRVISDLYEVTMVRNQYNAIEGIHIIGRGNLVLQSKKLVEDIINRVEGVTVDAPRQPGEHYARVKSLAASKAIQAYLKFLRTLRDIKARSLDEGYWRGDRNTRQEYIDFHPNLKTKKQFHAKR